LGGLASPGALVQPRLNLSSFDATERLDARVVRPETYRHLFDVIASEEIAIARGAGLSYAAASFGAGVLSIDLSRFDRILAHDVQSGSVEVEPGVQIGMLADFLAGRGRYLPAMPGYPSITVGGCMAFDIHGKSQFHSGNFAEWVEAFSLHHRDHGSITCSREQNAEIFALTLGGAGLTGIITSARLRTAPLPGNSVEVSVVPVRNLLEAAEALRSRAEQAACLYSWNNLNLRGASFGSGAVYVERFVGAASRGSDPRPSMDLRCRLPVHVWNGISTALSLRAYGWLQDRAKPRVLSLHAALFPLRGKELYFAGFGQQGFREYQLIVPFDQWETFVPALDRLLAAAKLPVTLGSLKLFRGRARLLRFSGAGICLALDVPACAKSVQLFAEIDALALKHTAVVNLSKDSRLSADICQRLFPEHAHFRESLVRFDPMRRYQSNLRSRVGV
jgi:decaprenylphospho-beta-D-ribofuranose 2-oxidase